MTQHRFSIRQRFAAFWLQAFFLLARRAPLVLQMLRPVVVFLVPLVSRKVRVNTRLNGRRIANDGSLAFSRGVVRAFYDFVSEVAGSAELSAEAMSKQSIAVVGREDYLKVRQQHTGAVLVTAHMGSFEVGLASLREVEQMIHVVFKRDALDGFEQMRKPMRQRLGVTECALDDGWNTLIGLRDALARDEVVVMQADRAMSGQKTRRVRLLGGTLQLPVGPVTLARINQSPIVPVFSVRESRNRFRICIEPAIDPNASDAIEQIGRSIEKFVARYPLQWLVLDAAFVEDAERAIR